LSLVFVVCFVGINLYDELITPAVCELETSTTMRRRTVLGCSVIEEKSIGHYVFKRDSLCVRFMTAVLDLFSVIYIGVKRSIMPCATHSEDSLCGTSR